MEKRVEDSLFSTKELSDQASKFLTYFDDEFLEKFYDSLTNVFGHIFVVPIAREKDGVCYLDFLVGTSGWVTAFSRVVDQYKWSKKFKKVYSNMAWFDSDTFDSLIEEKLMCWYVDHHINA